MLQMLCMSCGLVELSSDNPPFYCYYCHKNHTQCEACNKALNQHCGICDAKTIFVNLMVEDLMGERMFRFSNEKTPRQDKEDNEKAKDEKKTDLEANDELLFQYQPSKSSHRRSKIASQSSQCYLQDASLSLEDLKCNVSNMTHTVKRGRSTDDIKLLYPNVEHIRQRKQWKRIERMQRFQEEALEKYVWKNTTRNVSDPTYCGEETTQSSCSERIHAGEQQFMWRYNPKDRSELQYSIIKERMYRIAELESMKEALELQAMNEKLELLKAQCQQEDERLQLIGSQGEKKTIMFIDMPTQGKTDIEYPKDSSFGKNAIDERMNNVLKTVKEAAPKSNEECDFSDIKQQPEKLPPLVNDETKNISDVGPPAKDSIKCNEQDENGCSEKLIQPKPIKKSKRKLIYVRRVSHAPVEMTMLTMSRTNCILQAPALQSMLIQVAKEEEERKEKALFYRNREFSIKTRKKQKRNISNEPIQCPQAECHRFIFISDISKHLIEDHSELTMERISRTQTKTFFFDTNQMHLNIPKCQFLYLVRNTKIKLGKNEYGSLLPVMVMSCRIHLSDFIHHNGSVDLVNLKELNPRDEVFLMWLVGVLPTNRNILASISIFPLSGISTACQTVRASTVYPIGAPHNIFPIVNHDCALHITLDNMVRLNTRMIGVQVTIN